MLEPNTTVAPAGAPDAESVIVPGKPLTATVRSVIDGLAPVQLNTGSGSLNRNSEAVLARILKLAFEISKNTFFKALTLIRAVVVGLLGTITSSTPSLGVLPNKVIG